MLNLVSEHLLPAMQAAPLPEDAATREKLDQKLAQLALLPQSGKLSSAIAAQISGRTYRFEKSDQDVDAITLDLDEQPGTLTMQDSNGTHRIAVGSGAWRKGSTTLYNGEPQPVAASGAWTSDDIYVIRLCFYKTPFCPTLTFRFSGDQLATDWKHNVAFGPTEHPQIVGRAE